MVSYHELALGGASCSKTRRCAWALPPAMSKSTLKVSFIVIASRHSHVSNGGLGNQVCLGFPPFIVIQISVKDLVFTTLSVFLLSLNVMCLCLTVMLY